MATNSTFIDGQFIAAEPVDAPRYKYPFRQNGDRATAFFEQDYWQRQATWTPQELGIVHPTLRDFYLIYESEPFALAGGIYKFTRTFARLPPTQTVDGTTMITRPSPGLDNYPGAFGDYRIFQPDTTLQQFDAYGAQVVTSDSGAPSADGYPTGGTYTLTFAGDTTDALDYNDLASTVETALNALASVTDRGGLTVSGTYNSAAGLVVAFNSYAQVTIATDSLTNYGSKTETNTNQGYSQTVVAQRLAVDGSVSQSIAFSGSGSITATFSTDASATQRQFLIYRWDGITYSTITGGTYTLTLYGLTTSSIAYNASFATVQAALNALGVGSFIVSASPEEPSATSPLGSIVGSGGSNNIIHALVTWNGVPVTGGTFTLTAFDQTTESLDYNDSASTVETALNALSNVSARGNCTVTGTLAAGFIVSFSNAVMSATSSLLPSGSTAAPSVTDGSIGRAQKIVFSAGASAVRSLFCGGHGFATGDYIYAKAGAAYYTISPGGFSLPDGNTIVINSNAGTAFTAASAFTEAGKRTKQNYTPGSSPTLVNQVTRYSLSALTPDTYQGDDATLLQQIFAGNSAINYRVGDTTRWPFADSIIRSLTTTQVDAARL